MKKLIRDHIEGTEKIRYKVKDDEVLDLLKNKLIEEVQELIDSDCKDVYEYADVFEVLFEMIIRNKISDLDIKHKGKQKRDQKGAFKENWVIDIKEPKKNKKSKKWFGVLKILQ